MLFLTVLAPLLYLAVCANLLPAQQGTASPPRVLSAVALVLDRHGCVPGEIAFPAGNNLLEVVNRTGYDAITYHIRSTGQGSAAATPSVLDFTLAGRISRHYHVLELTPGSYEFTLDNGARWQCSISVK